MKESTRKILSFALASTVLASVPTLSKAEGNVNNNTVIEEVEDEDIVYTIQCGDTLAKISERFFGSKDYYLEICDYNNIENENVISAGDTLRIPGKLVKRVKERRNREMLGLPADNINDDRTYTVKCGDTMDCIVRVQYGSESRELVDKLATYNGLCDPNRISVGQILYLPSLERLNEVIANDYSCAYERMAQIQIEEARRKDCPYQRGTIFYPVCGVEFIPVYNCTVEYVPVYDCTVQYVPVVPGCAVEYPSCPKLTLKP